MTMVVSSRTLELMNCVMNLDNGTLEEVHDVEFDETKGSQVENENVEDVRGIQLSNAMKNMDVGELRPRQANDD